MFQKILVAIDEAEMNQKILEATEEIASNKDAQITLLHVGKDMITATMGLAYIPEDFMKEALDDMQKANQKKLDQAQAMLHAKGFPTVETAYRRGDAANQILEYAKETEQQLIIIGSRGLHALKELMLGSVSHKVAQLAKCPVLIVH